MVPVSITHFLPFQLSLLRPTFKKFTNSIASFVSTQRHTLRMNCLSKFMWDISIRKMDFPGQIICNWPPAFFCRDTQDPWCRKTNALRIGHDQNSPAPLYPNAEPRWRISISGSSKPRPVHFVCLFSWAVLEDMVPISCSVPGIC